MHNEYFYHNEPHNDAPSASVWARHMHYILNLAGDAPDSHEVGWVRVPYSKNKNNAKGGHKGYKA